MKRSYPNICRGAIVMLLLAPPSFSFCQTLWPKVLGSASGSGMGGTPSGQPFCMDWTVGEPVIETIARAQMKLTQGFHQYDEKVPCNVIIEIEESPGESAEIVQVFPNPTADEITVRLGLTQEQELMIVLTDLTGRTLYSRLLEAEQVNERISLAHFPAGAYFLRITPKNGSPMDCIKVTKISH